MTAPDTLPPELAELGELLREDPPRPDPAWARRLDSRAAAGFPRPPRRSLWAVLVAHRRALVPVVSFACVALLVVGLASMDLSSDDMGGGGSSSSSEGAGGGMASSAEDSAPKVAPAMRSGSPDSDSRPTRAQERSATMTLAARPREIEKVAAGILRVTDNAGGFVASSTVASGGGSGGSFELRIPNARLDKALAELSRLAKVRERTQSSRDITAQTVSARERLREARREREGLLNALARATTINETEAIKARLRSVNREIASARESVRRVVNRARYANVSVELVAERSGAAAAIDDGRWTPADAARDAVRVLEVAAGIGVIVLALLVPLALVGGLGVAAARVVGRRRRERALDMA
ncbi:MAG TPA: DUF4349 domain-containing protein [Solirubrobacteraceae bacterium]|nr:DUF4349 domain-containing protein [Solirubrobacteraceae bacterium]